MALLLAKKHLGIKPPLPHLQCDEGDGWVNWSGLATLLSDLAFAATRLLDRLLPINNSNTNYSQG